MKSCPKCKKEHNKSGIFCSRSCANSRTWSEKHRKTKSKQNKIWWKNLSETEKNEWRIKQKSSSIIANSKRSNNYIFTNSTETLCHNSIRKKILIEQNNCCFICGIDSWLQKSLILELDHLDGNKKNNKRENLRMLCPNCHSQTPTWRGKRR